MKPNFALSLSFSGIQLLQRQGAGWGRVGEVELTSTDLTGDLAALRAKAEALGTGPLETKLIIPDDQIKYLMVDVGTLDSDALHTAVMDALDGATPYDVSELSFDFATSDGTVHIAAVARETLQEAEAFANEHGFAPLGFVAAPERTQFPQEPNFGLSALGKDRGLGALESDPQSAIATGEAIAVAPAAPAKPDPEPEPETAVAPPEPEPVTPAPVITPPQITPSTAVPSMATPQAKPDAPEPAPPPEPGFSSRRSAQPAPPVTPASDPTPRLDGVRRDEPARPAASAPNLTARPTDDIPEPTQITPVTGKSQAALDESEVDAAVTGLRPGMASVRPEDAGTLDYIPPLPPALNLSPRPTGGETLDTSRSVPLTSETDMTAFTAPTPDTGAAHRTAGEDLGKASTWAKAGGSAIAGARGFLAKRAAASKAKAVPEVDEAKEEEQRRMTVFGARKPKSKKAPVPIGGKPRFLGLILTAILLLFLVSVAAWASVFLDEGLARFFGGEKRDRAIAELPSPDLDQSAQTGDDIRTASLDDGLQDIDAADPEIIEDGQSQIVVPTVPVLTPEEAEARYAATGIWQATPIQPSHPDAIALEDVYAASIDARITGQDAFALAQPVQPADALPQAATPPLAPGASFDFDENGFVIATPDGAQTPEGAVVFLGRPAVVPPELPQRLAALQAPATSDDATDPSATDTDSEPQVAAISNLRPKLRPDTLIEDTERSQLGGNSRAELARLRPKLRPRLEKEVQEAEAAVVPATAQAVAVSRKPSQRPGNFSRLVARVQKQQEQQQQAEPEATQVAAVAPRSVTPKIPSSASVAKTATVKNAINLSRVNLIGVYGKPSSRRALVRLSSGRYKKVKVGDRVDGGRVSAIGESQLNYSKNGRNITLKMPKG